MKKILNSTFILYSLLILLTFGGMLIKYLTDDIHRVRVEYVIYTNSGAVNKTEIYNIRGDEFVSRTSSHRGTNTVHIEQKHPWFAFLDNQSVCIYTGTNDVMVNKIDIIK